MADATVTFAAKDLNLGSTISKLQKEIGLVGQKTTDTAKGFEMSFLKMAGAVATGQAAFEGFKKIAGFGLSAVSDSIAGIGSTFTKAISKAAELETLETAFTPLLGSADAAKDRIAELSRFAASTPFELPEIAKASKVLETLTKGALATGDGLRLVGDVASATNQPFEEVATTIGRLYDGLQSGRPVGEAMQRLQELGAVSGDTRAQIEALSKEGKNTEAWLLAEDALNRFSGSMELQSGTWAGLLSTLNDNIGNALAKFGEPIMDRLKPYLSGIISGVEILAEKAAGLGKYFAESFISSEKSASAFQAAINAITTGKVQEGFLMFWDALVLQSMQTANNIYKNLSAAFATAADFLGNVFRSDGPAFMTILSAFDFLSGYISKKLFSTLSEVVGEIPVIGDEMKEAFKEKSNAAAYQAELALQRIPAAASLVAEDIGAQLGKAPELFNKNLASAGDIFTGLDEKSAALKVRQDQLAASAAGTAQALGGTVEQLKLAGTTAEKLSQVEAAHKEAVASGNTELATRLEKQNQILKTKLDGEQADARSKQAATDLVDLEIGINNAKADGNTELQKQLEQERERIKSQQEIVKLTEEYQKELGVSKDKAAELAEAYVESKDAAEGLKAKESERKKELMEGLEFEQQMLAAKISGNTEEEKALNYQKDYNAALKQAIDAGMGKSEAEAFADQIARARQEQAGINKELTASQKLLKDIADAEGKEGIDKGGKLAKRAQDQVARGDFEGARKTAGKIAENEAQAALTGTGKSRDRRNIADIGRDYGLNQGLGENNTGFRERIRSAREDGVYNDFSKTAKPASGLEAMKAKGSLKDELADRRAGVDKPGQDGQKPPVKDDTGGKKGLDGLVEKILELVQKIEPRLPVAALTA